MGQGCVAVVDPGEGSGGAASPLFLDQTEAHRVKKNWGGDRALPPYFKVWIWHCVASVEEDKTEAGRAKKNWEADWALPPYFKVWIWHCVASVEEDKVVEHLMPFMIKK